MDKILGRFVLVNFILFIAGSFYLGGSALNGKVENGRYYVGDHGNFKEVSKGAYTYSMLHGLSMLASVVVFVLVPRSGKPN